MNRRLSTMWKARPIAMKRAPHSKRDGDRAAIIRCAAATADKIREANVHERTKRARSRTTAGRAVSSASSTARREHAANLQDCASQRPGVSHLRPGNTLQLAKRFGEARLFRPRGAER
jgi:ribosomal protein L34E